MDASQAQARMREIQARQEQVVQASHRIPWWFVVAQTVLLLAFVVTVELVASPGVALVLAGVFLLGWAALVAVWWRRRPAHAHPSQYVRGRVWLTVGGGTVVGGLLGAAASVLADRLGAVGLVAAVLLMLGLMAGSVAAHPRLMAWARRPSPADVPAEGAAVSEPAEGGHDARGDAR